MIPAGAPRSAIPGATLARAHRPPIGTVITYSDSQAATTTFVVARAATGVRGGPTGHACLAPPRHPHAGHHYRHCTRYLTVGTFAHGDAKGSNRLRFSARLHGHALAPRAYRLTATPRSAAGATGASVSTGFTVVG